MHRPLFQWLFITIDCDISTAFSVLPNCYYNRHKPDVGCLVKELVIDFDTGPHVNRYQNRETPFRFGPVPYVEEKAMSSSFRWFLFAQTAILLRSSVVCDDYDKLLISWARHHSCKLKIIIFIFGSHVWCSDILW